MLTFIYGAIFFVFYVTHRLRPIDTHLALYNMLYNNSARNRYAEPVLNKTKLPGHTVVYLLVNKCLQPFLTDIFLYPKRVDILIPDFRYLLCFDENWFSISIFWLN